MKTIGELYIAQLAEIGTHNVFVSAQEANHYAIQLGDDHTYPISGDAHLRPRYHQERA